MYYLEIKDDLRESLLDKFVSLLQGGRGKQLGKEMKIPMPTVNFKHTPRVLFKKRAYQKMMILVDDYSTEVGWHGTVVRGEEEAEYIIEDIFVHPQTVTGATIRSDQKEQDLWLDGFEDEIFDKLKFQGHSHVNMSTTPSPTDCEQQEDIAALLRDDMFYVFAIVNKSRSIWMKIFDVKYNLVFEDSDIMYEIEEDYDFDVAAFRSEAKSQVKRFTYTGQYYYGRRWDPVTKTYIGAATGGKNERAETTGKKKDDGAGKGTGVDFKNMDYDDPYFCDENPDAVTIREYLASLGNYN